MICRTVRPTSGKRTPFTPTKSAPREPSSAAVLTSFLHPAYRPEQYAKTIGLLRPRDSSIGTFEEMDPGGPFAWRFGRWVPGREAKNSVHLGALNCRCPAMSQGVKRDLQNAV
jgi:hypothetical protein